MKKLLFILVALLPLFLSGCKEDDGDDNGELNGTVWEFSQIEADFESSFTIRFSETTFQLVGYTQENGVRINTDISGGYQYKKPDIVLVYNGQAEYGTISGNELKMTSDEDGMYMTFHKK